MYVPSAFSVKDRKTVLEFIRKHGFGILISNGEQGIEETHTPIWVSEDLSYLYGHIARANRQWKGWDGSRRVKVIFHGPHGYISPRYYVNQTNVPTWNYTAVSISGKIAIVEALEDQKKVIQELVAQYERGFGEPWVLDEGNEGMMQMFRAIVCFRIEIEGVEASFKLNQNKEEADRRSVIEHLKRQGNGMDGELARLMEESLEERTEESGGIF